MEPGKKMMKGLQMEGQTQAKYQREEESSSSPNISRR